MVSRRRCKAALRVRAAVPLRRLSPGWIGTGAPLPCWTLLPSPVTACGFLEHRKAPRLTRVNPFFSNEKPGRRTLCSTSGDFGKLISESLARAKPRVVSLCVASTV